MTKAKRPETIDVPPFRAVPKRFHEDKGWYWQVVYQGRGGASAWCGYGSREDVAAVLGDLIASENQAKRTASAVDDPTNLGELLETWMGSDVEPRREKGAIEESTESAYRYAASKVKRDIGSVVLEAVDFEVLDRYELDRIRTGAAASTVWLERLVINAAWKWAQTQGLVPNRKLPPIGVKPEAEKDPYIPTRAEVAQTLAAIRPCWQVEALRLQAATGARISEIAQLRILDIETGAGVVRIWVSKNEAREVPIAPKVGARVEEWLQRSGRDKLHRTAYLFRDNPPKQAASYCNGMLERACERTGLPKWTTHGLRYRAVIDMIDAGVDPKTACEITGHSLETMLKYYRKVAHGGKRAAIALAKLGYLPDAPGEVIDLETRKGGR